LSYLAITQTDKRTDKQSLAKNITSLAEVKITTYKSDQWYTAHLKTKIKPKDNVHKVKTTQI